MKRAAETIFSLAFRVETGESREPVMWACIEIAGTIYRSPDSIISLLPFSLSFCIYVLEKMSFILRKLPLGQTE